MDAEVIDQEPEYTVDEEQRIALRSPKVPVSLNELAALKGEAVEIVEARVLVLETIRRAALRATHPEDWILYKAPEDQGGQIVGYLQDVGCERVRDLYGINVYGVSDPVKVIGTEPGVFYYLIRGSGRCNLTRQVVEELEGGRSSADDFCKDKTGAALELAVRKAARANLDGNVVRELGGLGSVPIEELTAAWQNTNKKVERCRRGRGFGSRDERLGATRAGEPDVEPPTCPYCQPPNTVKLKYRAAKGDRKAFFGCPNYEKHSQQKVIVDAAKWIAEQELQRAQPASDGAQQGSVAPQASATSSSPRPAAPRGRPAQQPLTAGEIPFGGREPGSEG